MNLLNMNPALPNDCIGLTLVVLMLGIEHGLDADHLAAIDGLNSWWIARLVRRSDQTARIALRVMALAVSGVSLMTAGLGVTTQTVPNIDAWVADKALWLGAAIVVVTGASCVIGQRLVRIERQPANPTFFTGVAPQAKR